MSETNKSYRIKANVSNDTYVDVNLTQDIEVFEILSLKITSENFYKLHTADYGCIAGRVLANGNVGIPNAKVSVFIEADEETKADAVLSYLYPYSSVYSKNSEGVRYNLLTEEKLTACHQNVGTFPSKRLVLDDNNVLEIFDKYYKFTTVTNASGDYMIFGVPTGSQTLHMDLDISDIGDLLSQKPRDLQYKGYNKTSFENANMFKNDKSLDSLAQIFTQTESVYVYPFWGEKDEMGETNSNGVRITRKDIDVDYKFEPTCVFIGSIVSDEKSNGFTRRCIPTERMGKMDRITTGEGTIEMIRKKTDGTVESYTIQGNQLIDGNGTWCYQIPMNLDYVMTDEYGNIVPTDDPDKGVPTRTRVRFRVSLSDFDTDYENSHLVKVLIPNNPKNIKSEEEIDYVFGTNTSDNEEGTASFRDLFYNNVYTVKSYIPRLQFRNYNREKRFSGIKAVNVNVGNNPIPYNNMRIDITFLFTLQCAIMHMLIWIAGVVNRIIALLLSLGGCGSNVGGRIAEKMSPGNGATCITIGGNACPDLDGWYFAPRCPNRSMNKKRNPLKLTLDYLNGQNEVYENERKKGAFAKIFNRGTDKSEEVASTIDSFSTETTNRDAEKVCVTNNVDHFIQCIEIALAQEYEVIQFDFYNDWINGLLYIPRWFGRIRKKRSFIFGLIKVPARLQACVDGVVNYRRKYVQQCSLSYKKDSEGKYTALSTNNGCDEKNGNKFVCHKKKGRKFHVIKGGYIRPENTSRNQTVYYFKPQIQSAENNKQLVKLFATDIVLIGSLTDRNRYGIPQSFKSLPSSTYQMPTNIAATNLGHTGYMYSSEKGSYLCSNSIVKSGVTQVSAQTFSSESGWTNGMEYDEEFSGLEYAVTESAGIDWGYTGPGQEYGVGSRAKTWFGEKVWSIIGKKATYVIEQNRASLYQPGGHFLGISCTASEANVKSCVNLSRVCEINTSISSRIEVPTNRSGNTVDYGAATVPTGLISRDEIIDDGFRSEFATMNFNGLETMVDPLSRRRVYKFEIMNPKNFDGVFNKISSGSTSGYNDLDGAVEEDGKTKAYKRTVESTGANINGSKDYYDFRLGWHGGTDSELKQKYLISNVNEVALPIYENSFYFYFGLHDGATALDRFYSEFFAQCPDDTDKMKSVIVQSVPIDICSDDRNTVENITVKFVGFNEIVKYVVKMRPSNEDVLIDGNRINVADGDVSFHLDAGEYTVFIFEENSNGYDTPIAQKDFVVTEKLPDSVLKNEFIATDFNEEVYSVGNDEIGGYIDFEIAEGNPCIYITNGDRYKFINGNCQPPEGMHPADVTVRNGRVYVWSGNTDYDIYATVDCNGTLLEPHKIGSVHVAMPIDIDIKIGPYEGSTYRTIERNGFTLNDNWWRSFANDTRINDEIEWSARKALTYSEPVSENYFGKIDVSAIGGKQPYVIDLRGYGEKTDENTGVVSYDYFDNTDSAYEAGYDLSLNSFKYPTVNYQLLPVKGHYHITATDFGGDSVGELELPSIYLPFRAEYYAFRNFMIGNSEVINYTIVVKNGSNYKNRFKEIIANGFTGSDEFLKQGEHSLTEAKTLITGWTGNRRVSTYRADVVESAPAGYEGDTLNISETVVMPKDGYNLTSGVRYYYMQRRNSEGGTEGGALTDAEKRAFNNVFLIPDEDIATEFNSIRYKGSNKPKSFTVVANNKRFELEPGKELDRSKIFSGDISDVKKLDDSCIIVGVYDYWTNFDDEEYALSKRSQNYQSYLDNNTTALTVVSVYTRAGFIDYIENPELYPSSGNDDEGGETSEEGKFKSWEFRQTIHGQGVDSLWTDTSYGIYDMGEFTVSDVYDGITVPNIGVRMEGIPEQVLERASVRVRIFVINEEKYNQIKYGYFEELITPYSSYHTILDYTFNLQQTYVEVTNSDILSFNGGLISRQLGTLLPAKLHIVAVVKADEEVTHLESGTIIVEGHGINCPLGKCEIQVVNNR